MIYLCVITYIYDGPPFEIASHAMSQEYAERLVAQSARLNPDSPHILDARVYSESDYAAHLAGVT